MKKIDSVHVSSKSAIKRLIDRMMASLGLILLSPLFALIALAIYSLMGRPVLFCQSRVGYRGKIFTIFKFRTMQDIRSVDGVALSDGERTTRLGRFLRGTGLDELPQLWNVIRGDMSLVGPRPLLADHLSKCDAGQLRRLEARPGITGWAQVNGRNTLSWEEKFRKDGWYLDHWSHWLDLKIVLLTVITVARYGEVEEGGRAMTVPSMASVVEQV